MMGPIADGLERPIGSLLGLILQSQIKKEIKVNLA
jgi:hypothetical protein